MNQKQQQEVFQNFLSHFFSAEMNKDEIIAFKAFLKENPSFKKEVEEIAKLESHLDIYLALESSKDAIPIDPPAWALPNLITSFPKRQLKQISLWRLKDFILAFRWKPILIPLAAFCIVFIFSFYLKQHSFNEIENTYVSKDLKQVFSLDSKGLIAFASSFPVSRSINNDILSPNGITKLEDPILKLNSKLENEMFKVELFDENSPNTLPLKGVYKGKPVPLSEVFGANKLNFANSLYKIRILKEGQPLAETLFRQSNIIIQKPLKTKDVVQLSFNALKDNPPRPGDGLVLIEALPQISLQDQNLLRLRFLLYYLAGDLNKTSELHSLIK